MVRCITGVLVSATLFSAASANDFYRQDPTNSFAGLSSQDARNPGGLGWFSEVADNFPAEAGWSIGQVDFWGGYASLPGQPGNTEGFTVRFYTDNFGSPGNLVFEQDVMSFTREQYFVGGPFDWAGYAYSVDLDPPFVVPATEEMWISVVALLARGGGVDEPQWGWVAAATFTNPPFAHQWFFSPGNFTQQSNDVSFVLSEGSAAPTCPPDLNGDGVVDADDFFLFLQLFAAGDPRADFNNDGVIDADDFFAFLSAFAAGC